VLPTGGIGFIINFHERAVRLFEGLESARIQTFADAIVCGPRSEVFSIDMTIPTAILGVHFKPGGAFPFFPLPVHELFNAHISLEALWGSEAGILRERLLAAPTVDAKFRVMEKALLNRARRPLDVHPAVAYAMQEFENGSRSITDIAEQIGYSPQWFRRIFQEEVGLAPKVYYRIRRFQQVLNLVTPGQPVDWAEIALACGYFDQAHFINDFQSFTGFSPTAYLTHLCDTELIPPPNDEGQSE
jgi:AraC-like DNA-binding protein